MTNPNHSPALVDLGGDNFDSQLTSGRLFRILFQFYWDVRGRYALVILLQMFRGVCLGFSVFFLHKAINAFLGGREGAYTLFLSTSTFSICQALAALSFSFSQEAERWFKKGVSILFFRWTLSNTLLLPADYFRSRSVGQFTYALQKSQTIVAAFVDAFTALVASAITVFSVVASVLLQISWYAALGLGLVGGMAFLISRRTSRLRKAAREEYKQDLMFLDQALAMFSNLKDLRNYGLQSHTLKQFESWCQMLATRSSEMVKLREGAGMLLGTSGIVMLALMAGVALWLGMDVGGVITCFVAFTMILDPMSKVVRTHMVVSPRVEKISALLRLCGQASELHQRGGRTILKSPIESLQLEDVSYCVNQAPILDQVSLTLRRGELVGLIGRSGAGKTTLSNLLLRLLDYTSGTICINGQDARELELNSFWRHCAYVSQVPCPFGETLEEQVRLVRPGSSNDEVVQALSSAGIDSALRFESLESCSLHETPQKLWNTRSLKQKVEWARLSLRNASLVVLDEPTSLVDPPSEQLLLANLRRHRNDRITVVISHRLSTLAVCDRLLVVEQGKLVADGPREEVLPQWLSCLEQEKEKAS